MKNIICLIFIAIQSAFAQDESKMRIQASYGTSNFVMKNKGSDPTPDHNIIMSYGVRLAWDMVFIDPYKTTTKSAKIPFYFSFGVAANKKGAELYQGEGPNGESYSIKYHPYYVTMTEDFYIKPRIGQFNNRLFFGVGLYFGVAVGGNIDYVGDVPTGEEFEKQKIQFGAQMDKGAHLKRGEIGGKLLAGVELGQFIIGAELMKDFNSNLPAKTAGDKDLKGKFINYNITLGYFFKKRK